MPRSALRCAVHDRADPTLERRGRVDESALLLPRRSFGELLLAVTADEPRAPVTQAKTDMTRPVASMAVIRQQSVMLGAGVALRQHPLRSQTLVAPGDGQGSAATASSAASAPDRRRRPAPKTRCALAAAPRRRSDRDDPPPPAQTRSVRAESYRSCGAIKIHWLVRVGAPCRIDIGFSRSII